MKLSLRTQAVVGIGLIESSMLVILLYLVFSFIEASTSEEVERRAESMVRVFSATVSDDVLALDLASLYAFVEEAASTPGTAFARIIDHEGHLLAQAGDGEFLLKPFRPSIRGRGLPDVYMASAPIEKAGLNYGSVEIGLDLREQKTAIDGLKSNSLTIAVLEVLIAAGFSIAAGHYLVRRLNQMRAVVRRAHEENYQQRIDDRGVDEVSELAREIDQLMASADWDYGTGKRRTEDLKELNRLLQRKISELRRL